MVETPYQPTIGDRVQLRRKHPCGSDLWIVVRTGADIGLVCEGCARRVLLERPLFRKRLKRPLGPTDTSVPGDG